MSSVNHQRDGKAKQRLFLGQKSSSSYTTFHKSIKCKEAGKIISASSTIASGCSRKVQRDKRGAKKFLHTRFRRVEDAALNKAIKEGVYDGYCQR
jgi:hypothetical protein